jgi:hypothetical protein
MEAGDRRGRRLDGVAAGQDAGLRRLADQLLALTVITTATVVFRHGGVCEYKPWIEWLVGSAVMMEDRRRWTGGAGVAKYAVTFLGMVMCSPTTSLLHTSTYVYVKNRNIPP